MKLSLFIALSLVATVLLKAQTTEYWNNYFNFKIHDDLKPNETKEKEE